jgi:hypothetical protein
VASVQKIFLLPCECSAEIEVVSGQAGGTTACPACGRRADVPKLREFASLRTKTVDDGRAGRDRATRWGPVHAAAAAGLALAALAWGGAAIVGMVPKAAFSPDLIRSDVSAENDVVLYQSLDALENASVIRMPMREEVELQRRTQFAVSMSRMLAAIGGLGAAVAAIAGLTLLMAPARP